MRPGRFMRPRARVEENFFCLMPSISSPVALFVASRSITTWSPTASPRSMTTRIVPRPRSCWLNMASASALSETSSPGATTSTLSLR